MAGSRSQGAEFVLAGLAACGAITLTNPIDVVKTRLQLQGELAAAGGKAYTGIGQALLRISRKEGLRGLQRGLSAAYLLQFSNVGCRFGAYGSLKQLFGVKPGASATDSLSSMLLGAASGSLAAIVSNPFFLLKSRFQAAGSEDVLHQHSHLSLRTHKTASFIEHLKPNDSHCLRCVQESLLRNRPAPGYGSFCRQFLLARACPRASGATTVALRHLCPDLEGRESQGFFLAVIKHRHQISALALEAPCCCRHIGGEPFRVAFAA